MDISLLNELYSALVTLSHSLALYSRGNSRKTGHFSVWNLFTVTVVKLRELGVCALLLCRNRGEFPLREPKMGERRAGT